MAVILLLTCATVVFNVGSAAGQAPPSWDQRVTFDQSGKPLDEVIKWFAAQAKLKLVSKYPLPTTRFTFVDPENKTGKPGEYPLATIFDLINSRLMAEENLTLVYSEKSLTVVRVGSLLYDVERLVIPRVSEDELKDRPKTDIVEVLIKLPAGLDAEESAPPVKRMLGDFGRVTVMPGNQLILQADVGTLRKILPEIKNAPVSWKKRIVFDQSGKPWPEVLKWFATKARLPLVTLGKLPTGKFVFVDPDIKAGQPREYSLLQILDILNRDLQANHKLTMVRNDVAIALAALPASEIPGQRIPRVQIADLDERGETEIVEMVLILRNGESGEERAEKLVPILGAFGGVITPLDNRLIVRADVATVRQVVAILHAPKKGERPDVDWLAKQYPFEVDDKPLMDVVVWLCNEADLPLVNPRPVRLPGRFTFINPKDEKGNPRKYSLAEIFYILDDALREYDRRLLRFEFSVTVWHADVELPPQFKVMNPPRVAPSAPPPLPTFYEPARRCRPGLLGRLLRR